MIKFVDVKKKYKSQTVLSGLSFHVPKGKLVVLVGSSGCGKTTTLKMINRLITPSSGSIFIGGRDSARQDVIALRRSMGYVIQQTGLFPHMTVRENIEIIPRLEKRDHDAVRDKTRELMDMIGMEGDQFLDRYPHELSGGQQQRIGVARAFANDPEVILMDEPFSALDPVSRASLQDELVNLQDQLRKTIVFVTHDMDEAIKIADSICIMDQGKILQYDSPEEILKNPCNEFVASFVGKKRIWSSPEFIRGRDIMIETPVTCSENMTLARCLDRMHSSKVDTLLVVERKSNILRGIVSAKQLRRIENHSQPVSAVMNSDYLCTSPDASILDIIATVNAYKVSSLPVVSETKQLLGLVTKSSLFTTLSNQYFDFGEEV